MFKVKQKPGKISWKVGQGWLDWVRKGAMMGERKIQFEKVKNLSVKHVFLSFLFCNKSGIILDFSLRVL